MGLGSRRWVRGAGCEVLGFWCFEIKMESGIGDVKCGVRIAEVGDLGG